MKTNCSRCNTKNFVTRFHFKLEPFNSDPNNQLRIDVTGSSIRKIKRFFRERISLSLWGEIWNKWKLWVTSGGSYLSRLLEEGISDLHTGRFWDLPNRGGGHISRIVEYCCSFDLTNSTLHPEGISPVRVLLWAELCAPLQIHTLES